MKTDVIRSTVAAVETLQAAVPMGLVRACGALKVAYRNFVRWRGRLRMGREPAAQPGPRPVAPLDIASLHDGLLSLVHSPKRSYGTSALYQRFAAGISRRDLRAMVADARAACLRERRRAHRRISWTAPGVVWSMDDTEFKPAVLNHVQDLGSRYKFPVPAGAAVDGESIAVHLDGLFRRYGAPLFLKRDNGSNLNCRAVDKVLDEHMVMPLNSPAYYPQYNGSIERAQSELKAVLREQVSEAGSCPAAYIPVYAGAAVHELNHRPRRALNGRTSCQVFFAEKDRYRFDKWQRRKIYDLIQTWTARILNHISNVTENAIRTAWRTAAEMWLRCEGYITVTINGKVLPNNRMVMDHE